MNIKGILRTYHFDVVRDGEVIEFFVIKAYGANAAWFRAMELAIDSHDCAGFDQLKLTCIG